MNLNEIPKLKHADSDNFFLLAGPCAIEGEDMAMRIAERILEITNKLEIPFIFKGSFRKANRSRIEFYRYWRPASFRNLKESI
jgi:2-dehydro-3-deoxyphosphooctonate aldolase (KDO 8-P synthase)